MYSINIWNLIALVFGTVPVVWIALRKLRTGLQKLMLSMFEIGLVVYSGISTIYNEIAPDYIVKFVVFNVMYICVFTKIVLSKKGARIRINSKAYQVECTLNKKHQYEFPKWVVALLTLCFYSYFIVILVYPENNLWRLIRPVYSISGVFDFRDGIKANLISNIFSMIHLISMPFMFVYLNHERDRGKIIKVASLIVTWFYLQLCSTGYVSRYEMVVFALLVVIAVYKYKEKRIVLDKKIVIFVGIAFLVSLPMLLALQNIRLGNMTTYSDARSGIVPFVQHETDYGKYYNFCVEINKPSIFMEYAYWLITLPIPTIIAGSLKENVLIVNQYFTELYTGITYGSKGYSVLLPSLFGESLILYGRYFYWIHALFLGTFLGKTCRYIEKHNELELFGAYLALLSLTCGRGGSANIIATVVNALILYMIITKMGLNKKSHEDYCNFNPPSR